MKWRDLLLTLAVLLMLAPLIQAQTQPVGSNFSGGTLAVPLLLPDGSTSAPSLAFSGAKTTGLYRNGARLVLVDAGTPTLESDSAGPVLGSGITLTWSSTSAPDKNSRDAGLARKGAASLSVTNGVTGNGSLLIGGANTLALPAGALGFATAATSSVGSTGQGARLVVVCGPTAGTASLLFYAGTTNTPVVLANAVGGGLIGC